MESYTDPSQGAGSVSGYIRNKVGDQSEIAKESPDLTDSPIDGVSLDTIYEMLSNRRRRLILYYLTNSPDHRAEVGYLATQVAAWENDMPVSEVTTTERKRTYNTFQQSHLPRLQEEGFITHDEENSLVTLTVDPKQLSVFLQFLPRSGSQWFTGFLSLGTVSLIALSIAWVSVNVFHALPHGSLHGIITIAIIVLAVVQTYLIRHFL